MKTTYILFILAAFVVRESKQNKCHLRELNLCAAPALVAVRQNPIPQNDEEMDAQCNVIKETSDCVNNYTNQCITKLHREILSFAGEGPESAIKEYCTAGSELRKSVLAHSSCLTEAWNEQKSCTDDAQAALETIEAAPSKSRLDILCCTYQRFRKCSEDLVRSKCGENVDDFMNKISSQLVSNLPNLICRSCKDEDNKCNGLLPAPGTPPKGGDSNSIFSQLLSVYTS